MARSTAANIGVIGAAQLVAAVANQLVIIVLAHYLSPSDFGIFAICQVIFNLVLAVSTFGLEEAAIQTKTEPENAVLTAATLRIILAFVAAGILLVSAPFITEYFDVTEATLALQVLSISFILAGLAFVPRVWLKRELKFNVIALSSIVSISLWSATALVLGLLGSGFWALIIASMVGMVGASTTVWVKRPTKVRFRLVRSDTHDLMRFGGYMMATSLIVFLFLNLDKMAIGRMLGSGLLGVYWLAFLYGTQPANLITQVMTAVIFPTYVSVTEDSCALRDTHRKIAKYLTLLLYPLGIGIACISPSFVTSLLGSEWSDAVVPLSILSLFGIVFCMCSTYGVVFMCTKNTRQMFKQNIVMFVPFIVLLLPATEYIGLTGVAALFLAVFLVQFVWVLRSVSRILSFSPAEDLRSAHAVPFAASIVMAAAILLLWLVLGTSLVTLAVQIVIGSAVYVAVLHIATKGKILREARDIAKGMLRGSDGAD